MAKIKIILQKVKISFLSLIKKKKTRFKFYIMKLTNPILKYKYIYLYQKIIRS